MSTGAVPSDPRSDTPADDEPSRQEFGAPRNRDTIDAIRPDRSENPNETTAPPPGITRQLRSLDAVLRDGVVGPATIEQRVAYPRETVEVPPLHIGAEMLSRVPVRENERHISWHTEPRRHRYEIAQTGITLDIDRVTSLSGTCLSLLTPGGNSYWHAVIDGAARLATIPNAMLAMVDTVLYSADAIGQRELLALAGLPRSIALRPVSPPETLRVETLLLPWNLHGVFDYHPVINRFFDAVLANHTADEQGRIERLYVDRRGAEQRRLMNEEAVVTALAAMGFVAVRLEDVPIAAQINLFRQAAIIVAPHGAGLTNIGFASPGCIVIELMMDAYVNCCFRRIAAIRKIAYDCVIGTTQQPWAELDPGFHSSVWDISVDDVVRTIERAMEIYPQNRRGSEF